MRSARNAPSTTSRNSCPTGRSSLDRRNHFMWLVGTVVLVIGIAMFNSYERIAFAIKGRMSSLDGLRPSRPKPIYQISILGERNSGTRWLYEHIGLCFNDSISVNRTLTRYKHWFQNHNYSAYPDDTLVLAQFRNPYDWLKAMQTIPHHASAHIKLKWEEFIQKPWTTTRVGLDLLNNTKTAECQEFFAYNQLISCNLEPLPDSFYKKIRFSENQPFYELRQDGSGKPFKNIMEMRSAKIQNFLKVADYPGIADVWTLQYEYLVEEGTDHLLRRIEEWTGLARQCEAFPPQARRVRNISSAFVLAINDHLDWSTEALIGYTKRDVLSG